MSFCSVDIAGLDAVLDSLKSVSARADSASGAVMLKLAQAVADEAKAEITARHVSARGTPPDSRTGTLADSILAKMADSTTSQVEADAFYARFVEYGTHHMAPRPFMRLAIAMTLPRFPLAREFAVELAWNEIGALAADVASDAL